MAIWICKTTTASHQHLLTICTLKWDKRVRTWLFLSIVYIHQFYYSTCCRYTKLVFMSYTWNFYSIEGNLYWTVMEKKNLWISIILKHLKDPIHCMTSHDVTILTRFMIISLCEIGDNFQIEYLITNVIHVKVQP